MTSTEQDFENALKAAFEKGNVNEMDDPFAVDGGAGTKKFNIPVKSSKKRMRDNPPEKIPPVIEAVPMDTLRNVQNRPPKPFKAERKDREMDNTVDPRTKDNVYKMCLGYASSFKDICYLPTNFNADMSYAEMKFLLDDFQRLVQSHNELEMLRTGLVTGASVIEQGSSFIPGQPVKLNGLANNFRASITRFDSCLKEIAIKYANTCSFTPEQMMMVICLQICIHTHEMNAKGGNFVNEICKTE